MLVFLFLDLVVVEEAVVEVEGLQLKGSSVDVYHNVMVPAPDVVLKEGARRGRGFQSSSTSARNHIKRTARFHRLAPEYAPGPLVGMNVPVPDHVHTVLLVERDQFPGPQVAVPALVALP